MLIDYESIRKIDFIGDKTVGVCFEDIGFDHVVSDVDTGYHSHKNDGVNDLLYFLAPVRDLQKVFLEKCMSLTPSVVAKAIKTELII